MFRLRLSLEVWCININKMASLVLLHLYLFCIMAACNGCPNQCRCRNSRVKCHRIFGLPERFPENTTKIAIDQSILEEIPVDAISGLPSLIAVEFTNCVISTISENAFSEMNSLRNLRFKNCSIDHIQKHAFAYTGRRLKIEFLESIVHYVHTFAFFGIHEANILNWKTTEICNLLPNAFYNVTGLKKLIFENCQMTIGNMAFGEIHALQNLSISGTYFNTLACNGITEILKAKTVQLSGNLINCDCGIEWISHEELKDSGSLRRFLQTTTCARPMNFTSFTMETVLSEKRTWCNNEIRNVKTACFPKTSPKRLACGASTGNSDLSIWVLLAFSCLMTLSNYLV